MLRVFRNMADRADGGHRLLGVSTALCAFLVLLFVKFGVFFALHPRALHASAQATGTAPITPAEATLGEVRR
jgi:hypothetical protein